MQSLLDAVADWPSVGLSAADPSSTGARRVDRKYLMDEATLLALIGHLAGEWRVLEVGGARLLPYENVYFDTADRRLHRAAVQRHRRRVKVRTRRYGTAADSVEEAGHGGELEPTGPTVVAEAKHKGVGGVTLKARQATAAASHGDALAAFGSFDDALDLLDPMSVSVVDLEAVLRTAYRRLTLLGPDGSRLTVDVDVTCWNASGRVVFGDVIVETKSPGPATAADRFLWGRGVRPLRLSKCSTALSMLEPACGGNRWHRTVTRHDIRVEPSA